MEEDLRNMMSKTVKSSIIQLVCRSVKENGRQFRKETEDKINMQKKSKERTSCDTCAFYVYDDEYGEYYCDMNMDEDDYMRIISDRYYQCPYYRNGDEYAVVRKQI